MKQINTLSLFDGHSCTQIALTELGIKGKYYASEIDKHAIKVTMHNWPDTIQLGDVTKWQEWDINWSEIGLLVGGSPCQGFSFAGKQLAFDDPRSKLFFVFVEIWEHLKKHNPNAKFLLENVRMKKEHEVVISRMLNIEPIVINSSLLSAQNRHRNYWTNIYCEPYGLFGDMKCMIPQPKDRGILLKDILEDEVDEKYYLSDKMLAYFKNRAANFNQGKVNVREEEGKASCLTSSMASCDISDNFIIASRGRNPKNPKSRKSGLNTEQMLEPRTDGKTNCLTSVQKDNLVVLGCDYRTDEGIRIRKNGKSGTLAARARNDESCGQMVLIPEATKKGYAEVKPGECFDLTMPDSKTRRGRLMIEKSNCLTASKYDFMQLTNQFRIRRLTPTECKRLQTVPEWFDMGVVSDTQQYKMLGNGFTVEVIKHILSYL